MPVEVGEENLPLAADLPERRFRPTGNLAVTREHRKCCHSATHAKETRLRISTTAPYRSRTTSIIWNVSCGERPVSSVKMRTPWEIFDARSTTTIPSFWEPVAIAKEAPKVSTAQVSTSTAVAASDGK